MIAINIAGKKIKIHMNLLPRSTIEKFHELW